MDTSFMATDFLCQQELHGWIVYMETFEIAPGLWRGMVRIRPEGTDLLVRMRCTHDRPAPADAMADAKEFARAMLEKIAARLRAPEAPGIVPEGFLLK
jgi:hypothetical protein